MVLKSHGTGHIADTMACDVLHKSFVKNFVPILLLPPHTERKNLGKLVASPRISCTDAHSVQEIPGNSPMFLKFLY